MCPLGAEGMRRAQQRVRGAPEGRAARRLHPREGGEARPEDRLPLRGLPRLSEAHRAHLLQVRHERAGPEGGQARGQQGDLAPGKFSPFRVRSR